ncbi:MAG: NAD-dependent epimerase/dehydratase family protein [Alphaproteobacteria bacterium]|nr:NAD-dependent epimerase/dehydratase family protein [Alphaproteobacteria bacterium]
MKTWLITGGCGFIGSHLVDRLVRAKDRAIVLDDLSSGRADNLPSAAEFVKGDIQDAALVGRLMREADGCFHLAAIASVTRSNEDWVGTHAVNLTGTINIFDAAARARPDGRKVRVVYASSAAVYGDCPDIPLPETAPTRPLTAYGADKLGCELHGRVADQVHGVPNVGLRFFNVYGPRQDPASPYSGVIAIFAKAVIEGRTPRVLGDGKQIRDFIYVDNVVDALVAAMEREALRCDVFNVCTGRSTSIEALARLIAEACGAPPRVEHGPPRSGDIRESLGDPSRLRAALGVTASVAVADGMRRTLDWMRAGAPAKGRA